MANVIPQGFAEGSVQHQPENIASTRTDNRSEDTISLPPMLAGTTEGLWLLGSEPQVELKGHSIDALAPTADGLWAIVDRNALWHRDRRGDWQAIAASPHLRLNCLGSTDGMLLVGTAAAHLLQLEQGSLSPLASFEQVEGREQWYTPWGGPPDVRSIAISPAGEFYVNVHVGGILRSSDQGRSWQSTIDFHADVHEVRTVSDRSGGVVAATAQGLAMSADGGHSWQFDHTNLHAAYARAVAVSGETLLMSSSQGPHGGKAAIYRRPLRSTGTFEKRDRGLPEWFKDNINTGCLDLKGDRAAFGTQDGQIFISEDAGLTWQRMIAGLAPIRCLSLKN